MCIYIYIYIYTYTYAIERLNCWNKFNRASPAPAPEVSGTTVSTLSVKSFLRRRGYSRV